MRVQEDYIDWIERYVNGDLTIEEIIWVEQQLAEHEQWRDVYEGVLVADREGHNLDSSLSSLEERILAPKKTTDSIIPLAYRKWIISAAAIAGFLLMSYAAIRFINNNNSNQLQAASNVDPLIRHEADEIQIIPPRRRTESKVQVFSAEKIERIASETTPVIEYTSTASEGLSDDIQLETAERNNFLDSRSLESEIQYRITKVDSLKKEVVDDYPSYLARYGYRVITNPDLLNVDRGASEPSLPNNHFHRE